MSTGGSVQTGNTHKPTAKELLMSKGRRAGTDGTIDSPETSIAQAETPKQIRPKCQSGLHAASNQQKKKKKENKSYNMVF